MKKLLSILLALMLLVSCTASAETFEGDAAGKPVITVLVLDAQGKPMTGVDVTVYLTQTQEQVITYVTDGNPYELTDLEENAYSVRATDPADGYSDTKHFYYDPQDTDQELQLVIRKLQAGTHVTVGSVTRTDGEFATELWSNNTASIDVRALLHGYSTVAYNSDLQYGVNYTILSDIEAETDEDGNKTYTFTLRDDLKYNDNSALTAADFVFSVLMQSSAVIGEMGGNTMSYAQLVGQEDYLSGRSEVFSGVRLLSDTRFALTIRADALPYFYELTYVNVMPYPMAVIAPGCTIADDGNGAYITGPFDKALLENTLRGENGYCAKPTVTTGPYQLVSYDAATGTVEFQVNKNYLGNFEQRKPVIEFLTLKLTGYEESLTQLQNNELDILNKFSREDVTSEALAMTRDTLDENGEIVEEANYSAVNYVRNGYGFVGIACEDQITSSAAVRQAMSYCLDADAMIKDYLGENGLAVYSYYGFGQWMAQPYVTNMDEYVTTYPVNLDDAIAVLAEDGWTLNADGAAYEAGKDTVRYKDMDGTLTALTLRFAQMENNVAAQWLQDNYVPVLQAAGFSVETEVVPFEDILLQFYRQTERRYNMTYLASNFMIVFDPYYNFNLDDAYIGVMNTTGIADEELQAIAYELRRYDPEDLEGYTACWLRLMQRYADVLPTIPVYTNIYYDFFDSSIQDYAPNAQWGWGAAILYSWIAE